MAIKLLICGYESSGKSTLTSQIENSLVINFDKKEYNFQTPHTNIKEYEGMDNIIKTINNKLVAYKDKFGEFPKYLILDTVTQLYTAMSRYNSNKYSGFNIHTQNNTDTLNFNDYIENTLLPNGVSVIIVAHTIVDPESGRHIIPAQGNFAKCGSWYSVVNDSIFIEKSSGKLVVHFKGFKYPTRSSLKDIVEKVNIDEFNINEYLERLNSAKSNAKEYIL